jgi:hypothetical protein
MTLADYALGSAPRLLRLAHQLTGDPDLAVDVVVRALGRVPRRRPGRSAAAAVRIDERVLAEVVRIALRDAVPRTTTRSDLDDLTHQARVAVVLALGLGWDADGIGETMHTSTRRVRSEVATAIATKDERRWRQLLDDRRWALDPPRDLTERAQRTATLLRAGSRHRWLGVAAAVVLLVSTADVVGRAATAPEPLPTAAHVRGLLDWPVRGDLARDHLLFDSAAALWRSSPGGPTGRVHLLWAGHVGVGRLVVLQARSADSGLVAVVADHDVSFRHPVLRLDASAPMRSADLPFLTIPYDGNLNIPGLQPGPGSRVVQLLTAPDVTRVEQRRVLDAQLLPGRRPPFTVEPLAQGMSQPWLDLTGQRPATAVRVTRRGRRAPGVSLLDEGLLPVTAAPVVVSAAGDWAGLHVPADQPTLTDDALWWAQDCRRPNLRMTPLWGSTSSPSAGLRVELVDCATQFTTLAVLRSAGSAVEWLSGGDFSGPAVEAYGFAVSSPGPPLTVVVGSSRVRSIVIGASRIPGRVAVAAGRSPRRVAAFDAGGHQLSMFFVGDR